MHEKQAFSTFRHLPADKQERVLDAALAEFAEQGYQAASLNRVVAQAGIAKGSLYQYFPNKEAILAAVYAVKLAADAEALVLRTRGIDEIAQHSLEDSLRAVIHSEIEMHRSFSRLNQQFYGRYHRTFDLLKAANQRAAAHGQPSLDEWFPRVLERHRERLRVSDLALASVLVTRTIEGAMRFAIEERPDLLDSTAFEEELLALLLRYLEASPP